MSKHVCTFILAIGIALATAGAVSAQTQVPASSSQTNKWQVTVYPIFIWVPLGITTDVNVPPSDGGSDGGVGRTTNARLDGAFLGGVSTSRGVWRIDADGLWAAFGGDRPETPSLSVDVDAFYGHATGGVKIYKNLYVTAGVRRYALKYDITLGSRPNFERKLGLWDPLVGAGWHYVADKLEVHATFDGGGFGVGADVDLAGTFHLDWKPVRHFGVTGGYSVLYFKASDTLLGKTFTVKQTLHGPLVGIGLYF